MKITENSPEKLEAKESVITFLVIGAAFIAIGISLLVSAGLSLVSIISLGLGLLIVAVSQQRVIQVDKVNRTIRYSAKSLIKKTNKLFTASEVKSISLTSYTQILQTNVADTNRTRTDVTGILVLNLHNGESVQLAHNAKRKRLFQATKVPNDQLGRELAIALNVPFEAAGQKSAPPTTIQALR